MTRTRFWVAAVYCLEPPQIPNGGFRLSTNSTLAGTVVDYYCLSLRFKLSGPSRLVCQPDGHYDRDPPVCTGAHQRFALSLSERRPRNPDRNEKNKKKRLPTRLGHTATLLCSKGKERPDGPGSPTLGVNYPTGSSVNGLGLRGGGAGGCW